MVAALATFLPAVKIGQFHPWLHVLRRRPRAALLGAARAGALVGVLLVIGAPSLYLSVTLMLLPALVTIRREVALTGALLIATSTYAGAWLGILVVAVAVAAAVRVPALLEPPGVVMPSTDVW